MWKEPERIIKLLSEGVHKGLFTKRRVRFGSRTILWELAREQPFPLDATPKRQEKTIP